MRRLHDRLANPLLQAMLILAVAADVQATPTLMDASRLSRPCMACHQLNAWGSADGIIPALAGQQARYLEEQLALFRSGSRVDAGMAAVAAHQSLKNPNDIPLLARHLAGLDANPHPVTGSGDHLRVGQELYAHICAACHGTTGRGDAENRVPRIAAQHYPYLRRQIEAAADLHKDFAPPEMTSALRGTRPAERDALADYISRLGAPEALTDQGRVDESGI